VNGSLSRQFYIKINNDSAEFSQLIFIQEKDFIKNTRSVHSRKRERLRAQRSGLRFLK